MKPENTECEQCLWRDDCVNVGDFADGACLDFELAWKSYGLDYESKEIK